MENGSNKTLTSNSSIVGLPLLERFERISEETGKAVRVLPEYGNVLALTGSDNKPVLLYEFVEELDNLSDYAELRKAFPNLSFAQIGSALAFLRKVCQFNTKGVDIDELEDAFENDADFKELMKVHVSNAEASRVFHP